MKMVLLIDGVRYHHISPDSEEILEKAIKDNYQHIFGPDSFYFDLKRKIRSTAGIGSIPDAYVIFFDPNPKLCILEVELASHPLYDHLIPQLTKFNRGIADSSTRKKIVDRFYATINSDEVLKARIKRRIGSGEIYKFLSDLISENPLIVVAIDERTDELKEVLSEIRGNVKILEFKSFCREGVSDPLNAYVFNPIVEITGEKEVRPSTKPRSTYKHGTLGNAIFNLFNQKGVENVTYKECELLAKHVMPTTQFNKNHFSWYKNKYRKMQQVVLPAGLHLRNMYKGKQFTAEVLKRGKIKFDGQIYNSPSAAAVAAIQSTGSPRSTEDGWRWWKFTDPATGGEKIIDALRRKNSH